MTIASLIERTATRAAPRDAAARDAATAFLPLEIAADRCKGCGLCIDVCQKHVLELDSSVINPLGYHPVRLTDAAACTSCARCARICPDAVYTVFARPKGA